MTLPKVSDSSDVMQRCQLAMLRVKEIRWQADAAAKAGDLSKLKALGDEMEVLRDSFLEIRRQQIMDSLPKPKAKRGWLPWRRSKSPAQELA